MNVGNSDRPSAAAAATALPEEQGLLVMGLSRRVQRRSPSTSCACAGELERVAQRGREPVGDQDARLLQIMDGSHERRE